MSSKGNIKNSYKRFGISFRIVSDIVDDELVYSNGSEYGVFELNTQATKPFTAAYFIKTFTAFDTKIEAGGLLEIQDKDKRRVLVTIKNPDIYMGEAVRYMSVCYLTNNRIKLNRVVGSEKDPVTRENTPIYEVMTPSIYVLLTEGDFRAELLEEEIGDIEVSKKELYLQSKYGAELDDEIIFEDPGEKTMFITQIKKSYFDGIDFCIVDYK